MSVQWLRCGGRSETKSREEVAGRIGELRCKFCFRTTLDPEAAHKAVVSTVEAAVSEVRIEEEIVDQAWSSIGPEVQLS